MNVSAAWSSTQSFGGGQDPPRIHLPGPSLRFNDPGNFDQLFRNGSAITAEGKLRHPEQLDD